MSSASIQASQLWFTAPGCVEVRDVMLPTPTSEQVLVESHYSAVSAGTELLAYRGQLPAALALDSSLASLQQSSSYPLQYGYACVGDVEQIGSAVDPAWQGRKVFSFQPHASHFLARPDELLLVPDSVPAQAAVFLPNMETAINLCQDGQPLLGEQVVVLGQGIVGLLLTSLLARYPLTSLTAVEGRLDRQALARRLGVDTVLSPEEIASKSPGTDADLLFEVSGHPEALNLAIGMSGYASRIVVGSWYGSKAVPVDLGGAAHRNRLQMITSQVSTVAPALGGRWNKERRFQLAWEMMRLINPSQFITHTLPLSEAGGLYRQLDGEQADIVQALFQYR